MGREELMAWQGTSRRTTILWPVAPAFLLGLLRVSLVLVGLVQVGVLVYAYQRIGISPAWLVGLVALSMLGSAVNLPVARLPAEAIHTARMVSVFGMRDLLPEVEQRPGTVVAVNLGGAVVPASRAGYLIVHNALGWQALAAVAIVTAVVHRLARPIPGLGIAVPALVPALIAAGVGLVIAPAAAPALAYVAGVFGTLVGADVLNLRRVRALGAPVVSIGGAGTFDGIYLTGVIAVLIASL
jgi:uncharacterized membrane protein